MFKLKLFFYLLNIFLKIIFTYFCNSTFVKYVNIYYKDKCYSGNEARRHSVVNFRLDGLVKSENETCCNSHQANLETCITSQKQVTLHYKTITKNLLQI